MISDQTVVDTSQSEDKRQLHYKSFSADFSQKIIPPVTTVGLNSLELFAEDYADATNHQR